LAQLDDCELDDDKIFVSGGPLWTSPGMSACIDLALGLVGADLGTEVSKAVARMMVGVKVCGTTLLPLGGVPKRFVLSTLGGATSSH
jgi:transcriptional regulator GlxA family with amidase domain